MTLPDARLTPTLPPEPSPLPTEFAHKSGFFVQAARASWRAPFVALVLGVLTMSIREKEKSAALVIDWTNAGIIALGTILSLVALYGAFGKRIRGIAVPAIAGLLVNGLLIASFIHIMSTAKRVSQTLEAKSREQQLADAEQQGRDVFEKYPGWFGGARFPELVITAAQWNEDAPATREMKSYFTAHFSIFQYSINNVRNTQRVIINPDSTELHMADGSIVKALKTQSIFSTAREDRDRWIESAAKQHVAGPHTQLPNCACFVPDGTDFTRVQSVTVELNGERVVILGEYYSAQGKRDLLERARQANPSAPESSSPKSNDFHL